MIRRSLVRALPNGAINLIPSQLGRNTTLGFSLQHSFLTGTFSSKAKASEVKEQVESGRQFEALKSFIAKAMEERTKVSFQFGSSEMGAAAALASAKKEMNKINKENKTEDSSESKETTKLKSNKPK